MMITEAIALTQLLKPKEPVPTPQPPTTSIVETPKQKPQKKLYTIKTGDTLTSIAKKKHVPVKRLWAKNKQLKNPDVIKVGEALKLPSKHEKLPNRPFPHLAPQTSPTQPQNSPYSPTDTSGNLYDYHSCTWHVKSRRPDLPNNLGNADTWFINAQAQGIPVGSKPKAGAVGQQGGHVVYIEKVKGNRVYLSERNYDWNGSYRERWANASDFVYIY